jgi:hypothetical protein
MPQLDQFTYLTQFVWLCIFYMTFYVLLFNDGLPKISRILKLRAHLVSQQKPQNTSSFGPGASGDESSQKADLRDSANAQDIVIQTLNSSISYLNSSITTVSNWCTNSIENINVNQLKPVNRSYLYSIGAQHISQLIKYSALEASAPITFSSPFRVTFLKTSVLDKLFRTLHYVWALRVQKCLLSSINKKKKKK